MKKNSKSILLIVFIAIILLLLGLILTISKLWQKSSDNSTQVNNLKAEEEFVINCKDENNDECLLGGIVNYKKYKYIENIEDIQTLFEQFNLATSERYHNETEDLVEKYPDECSAVMDKYLYRNMTSNFVYYYEDMTRDVISITNEITYTDFCTGNVREEYDVYLYSKKLKDFIVDEQDMFDSFELSREQVNEMITNYSKKENIDVDISKITKYQLFYNTYGQLIIDYKYDEDTSWRRARNV